MSPARKTKNRRGHLFVVAAPSGAGKTSLVKALLDHKPELRLSISHTTRKQRPNERQGREYYFVDADEFKRLSDEGAFLEHARVFDNWYGTGRQTVENLLASGHDVILEIDWQGAQQVRKAMADAQTIFILPPSRRALEERLRSRMTDPDEVIERRLRDAVSDMGHWKEFDYVIVNDDFERAVADLAAIVGGRGAPFIARRAELGDLLQGLLNATN